MLATYKEPRWDSAGNVIAGVDVTVSPEAHQVSSCRSCGNLPACYGCGRELDRSEDQHTMKAYYVEPQPTGDILRDYVTGGNHLAAYAHFCERCCPVCLEGVK